MSAPGRAPGRVAVVVGGVVQGVGFRWFVQRTASGLGLSGWVANRSDGRVELVAEGEADAIDKLLTAVRDGPPGAWVRDVSVRPEAATGMRGGFSVRPGDHPGD